jgi:hypothetical protein
MRLATESLERNREQIAVVLAAAARELLVLDNLEQLGEQVLPLLQQLAGVSVPVLATSRLAIRAPLIRIVDVPPLDSRMASLCSSNGRPLTIMRITGDRADSDDDLELSRDNPRLSRGRVAALTRRSVRA